MVLGAGSIPAQGTDIKFYCMDKRQILAMLYQERERCYERGKISRGDEIEDEMWALTKDDEDLPY